jgi:hypothetical protein
MSLLTGLEKSLAIVWVALSVLGGSYSSVLSPGSQKRYFFEIYAPSFSPPAVAKVFVDNKLETTTKISQGK